MTLLLSGLVPAGWTPFLIACMKGESETMQDMMEHMHRMHTNAVIERIIRAKSNDGHDALTCAIKSGSAKAVQAA